MRTFWIWGAPLLFAVACTSGGKDDDTDTDATTADDTDDGTADDEDDDVTDDESDEGDDTDPDDIFGTWTVGTVTGEQCGATLGELVELEVGDTTAVKITAGLIFLDCELTDGALTCPEREWGALLPVEPPPAEPILVEGTYALTGTWDGADSLAVTYTSETTTPSACEGTATTTLTR